MAAYPRKYPNGVTVYAPTEPDGSDYHKRTYRVVWKEGDQRRSSYAPDADAASEVAKDVVRQLTEFQLTIAGGVPRGGELVDALFDFWLSPEARTRGPWEDSTREQRAGIVRTWLSPMLGHLRCVDWSVPHSDAVLQAARRQGLSTGHQRNILQAMRQAAKAGRKAGFLPQAYDPTVDLEVKEWVSVKVAGESHKWVRSELIPDVENVWEAAHFAPRMTKSKPMPQLVNAILLPAYVGGLRAGEVFGLRRRDIDLDKMRVQIVNQKDQKGVERAPKHRTTREAIFPAFLVDHLWWPDGPNDLMVPTVTGIGMRPHTWQWEYWTPLRHELDWPTERCDFTGRAHNHDRHFVWNYHSLRHFYATWALSDNDGDAQGEYVPPGVPSGGGYGLMVASQTLGHSSVDITAERYVSARKDDLDRAARKLNGG